MRTIARWMLIYPYGYHIAVLDLRNPTRSDGNNLLHLINKYMDIYKANPSNLAAKAKSEKYAKILAKTLINTSGGEANYGQNQFFYDAAEGLLTAMLLLVAEYLPTTDAEGNPIEQRHIVSVFKLVQELVGPSKTKGKSQFQELMEKLPPNHSVNCRFHHNGCQSAAFQRGYADSRCCGSELFLWHDRLHALAERGAEYRRDGEVLLEQDSL